ncbi:uncharacterized protein MCAP_0864-like [Chironomus tepperi]|uniref:uncharacterized protein MCAP_0864-like n=1 Tax=Chironomus tepperi TaxID=113505 RepID=UPI00391EF3FF
MINAQLISLLLIFFVFNNVNAVDIQCEFRNDDFDAFINQYTCVVQVNLMITAKNTAINLVRGSHNSGKNNNDITGLSIRDKRMQYMPANLADKFKNLIAMRIRNGKLKEVSQSDFKSFPKLRYLNLDANDLEVLDDDLFEFNPLLEVIWFEGNKIKAIGQSTFANLKNLRDLDMNGNICYSKRMSSKYDMSTNMAVMKQKCYNSDAELSKLKIKYREIITNNTKLTLDVDELKSEINEKDMEIEKLTSSIHNLTELIANSAANVRESEIKIDQLKGQLAEKQTQLNLIKSQLEQSNFKNREIVDQMTKLEEKYKTMTIQTSENENTFKEQIDKFQLELDEKELRLQDLVEKFNNSQHLSIKTQQTLKELQDQLSNQKQIERQLRQNTTKLELALDTHEINNDNLTDIIANNSLKILTYEQEINQLKLQINETKTKFEVINSERLQLSIDLKNISFIKQQMENNLKNLTEHLKKSEEDLTSLEILNDELSSELVNQTQIAEAMIHKGDNQQSNGETLLFIGSVVMILLTIVNVFVALKYYRKKTIVLRQIEADDSYCDDI